VEHLVAREPSGPARRGSELTVESRYTSVPLPSPSSAAVRSPIDFTEFSVGPWVRQDPEPERRPPSIYVFGQPNQDDEVSLATASRLVFWEKSVFDLPTFTVLSPTADGRFRKRQADRKDKRSMVFALRLPSDSCFLMRDNSKRFKIAGPATIVEEARSERLNAAISVPRDKVQEIIGQFENGEESEEEL
jgi:hypothetical protein